MISKFSDYKAILKIDMNSIINKALHIPEVQKTIIDYNQKEQLSQGLDANGKWIETIASNEQGGDYPYSKFTVSERSKKGLQIDAVDLKDTGAFWESFEVKVNQDSFEVLANFTIHGEDIRGNFDKKYDFLGLTEDSKDSFALWLLDAYLSDLLRKELTLS